MSATVRRAVSAAMEIGWADPRRLYHEARLSRQLLDLSRSSVAGLLAVPPESVSFTSSGTTAIQLAMTGLWAAAGSSGQALVAGAVEHSAVLRWADALTEASSAEANIGPARLPAPVLVEVDGLGRVTQMALAQSLGSGAGLVAVQSANHELGSRQPLRAVHAACRAVGTPLFVDACAGLPDLLAGPDAAAWDVLVASAHKFGGPPGVGILAIRPGTRWQAPIRLDEWEAGRVPGFPAVAAIAGAATALEEACSPAARAAAEVTHAQTTWLRAALPAAIPDSLIWGDPTDRLPHISNVSLLYAAGDELVRLLDEAGFAVSSGSSCTSDTRRPSHVLVAIGAITHGNLRISLPPGCPDSAVEQFLAALIPAVRRARDSALGG
ncbi:MAG: cysteine desulfurase family protein [Candidatus Nanopelagicales bacterium]